MNLDNIKKACRKSSYERYSKSDWIELADRLLGPENYDARSRQKICKAVRAFLNSSERAQEFYPPTEVSEEEELTSKGEDEPEDKIRNVLKASVKLEPKLNEGLDNIFVNPLKTKIRTKDMYWEGGGTKIIYISMLHLARNHPNDCVITRYTSREKHGKHTIQWLVDPERLDIDRGFMGDLEKCMRKSARFILAPLGLRMSATSEDTGHANMLIFDLQNKRVFLFDPYGHTPDEFKPRLLNKALKKTFSKFEYEEPRSYCPVLQFQGPQYLEETDNWLEATYRNDGFCSIFSHWFADLRLSRPDLTIEEVYTEATQQVWENPNQIANYILEYAKFYEAVSEKLEDPTPARFEQMLKSVLM